MKKSLICILTMTSLVGCGGSSPSNAGEAGARATVTEWATDFASGNYQGACDLMTAKSKDAFKALGSCPKVLGFAAKTIESTKLKGAPERVRSAQVTVTGTKATIRADLYGKGSATTTHLTYQDGHWRVEGK